MTTKYDTLRKFIYHVGVQKYVDFTLDKSEEALGKELESFIYRVGLDKYIEFTAHSDTNKSSAWFLDEVTLATPEVVKAYAKPDVSAASRVSSLDVAKGKLNRFFARHKRYPSYTRDLALSTYMQLSTNPGTVDELCARLNESSYDRVRTAVQILEGRKLVTRTPRTGKTNKREYVYQPA